ncbi:unnamed protein product [Vicia faba]|uniref:Uncharacterized protein n=1 Tax=Vicia faba TaxID=3906 RepID=A0AAV0ZUJ2_VICFA|nr:unnamed protein product [Vicia faba]
MGVFLLPNIKLQSFFKALELGFSSVNIQLRIIGFASQGYFPYSHIHSPDFLKDLLIVKTMLNHNTRPRFGKQLPIGLMLGSSSVIKRQRFTNPWLIRMRVEFASDDGIEEGEMTVGPPFVKLM